MRTMFRDPILFRDMNLIFYGIFIGMFAAAVSLKILGVVPWPWWYVTLGLWIQPVTYLLVILLSLAARTYVRWVSNHV